MEFGLYLCIQKGLFLTSFSLYIHSLRTDFPLFEEIEKDRDIPAPRVKENRDREKVVEVKEEEAEEEAEEERKGN